MRVKFTDRAFLLRKCDIIPKRGDHLYVLFDVGKSNANAVLVLKHQYTKEEATK